MITEYFRPQSMDEALTLISQPDTFSLGGGTFLTQPRPDPIKVVDLQALGLNKIRKAGNDLEVGATATLQQLLETEHAPQALKAAIQLEAPLNLRNMATVAGALVACDGRSTFATAMLALDAQLLIQPNDEEITLGNLLPLRDEILSGKLITKITIPLQARLTFEQVARTPVDKPIICVALAVWPSGRARLALGGWGDSPSLAMDGRETSGIEIAARNAAHDASDEWASSEYRMHMAETLAKRQLTYLQSEEVKE